MTQSSLLSMIKFKVGDKVICVCDQPHLDPNIKNVVGTILTVSPFKNDWPAQVLDYAVKFGDFTYYMIESQLELHNPVIEEAVITQKFLVGDSVIANFDRYFCGALLPFTNMSAVIQEIRSNDEYVVLFDGSPGYFTVNTKEITLIAKKVEKKPVAWKVVKTTPAGTTTEFYDAKDCTITVTPMYD